MPMQNGAEAGEGGIVDQHRFCIGCGYNLRTLHWDAKCPECGRAVLDSLGKNLYSADRKWLASLWWGMALLSVQVLMVMGTGLAGGAVESELLLLAYLLPSLGPKTIVILALSSRGRLAAVLGLVAMVLYGLGSWLLSRTGSIETAKSSETNTWLRAGAICSTVLGLFALGSLFFRKRIPEEWLVFLAALLLELLLMGLTYSRLAQPR